MDIQDCIRFANENPVCALATCEGDQPRVRYMAFWRADETGFYFESGAFKAMVAQIVKNPNVEICFHKPGNGAGTMLRVTGKAEFVTDVELKKQVVADRPFLKMLGLDFDSPNLTLFRIAQGTAHFWTMETNLRPKEYIPFGPKA